MGGLPPLGYDPHPDPNRRELVVNSAEAAMVQRLFTLYLTHGCLNAAARVADGEGLRSKRHVFASGRSQGGTVFSRGQLYRILINPIYRGLIRHKDKTWPGTHPAIIEEDLWAQVQERLQLASTRRRGTRNGALGPATPNASAPLLGKFRDEAGDLLTPTHTQRRGRRLRYYVSNGLLTGKRKSDGWRLPAPAFETAIADAIADHLETRARHHRVMKTTTGHGVLDSAARVTDFIGDVRQRGASAVAPMIVRGEVTAGRFRIELDPAGFAAAVGLPGDDIDPELLIVDASFTCRRRGIETKIIAGDPKPVPDQALIRALRNAHRWAEMLKAGTALRKIARRDNRFESYVARIIPLATLSPRIQVAIVNGTQPPELSLETFVRAHIPLDWLDQERRLRLDD